MDTLVVLSVVVIVVLIGALALFLYILGTQLSRIATNLEDSFDLAVEVVGNAQRIDPGLEHINRTGGVVAGALPLLYGMAESIVSDVAPKPAPTERPPALPAEGRRRSRMFAGVGYNPDGNLTGHPVVRGRQAEPESV